MNAEPTARAPVGRGLGGLWNARPARYSPALWALILVLDLLPWPWGEEILARLFAAAALVRPSRLRTALTWAAAQPGARRWPLALSLCASRGRWVARWAIIGLRHPDDLRPHIVVKGEEHLAAATGGTILLGFHLGPPSAVVALRIMGHPVAWVGGRRVSRGWSRQAWRLFWNAGDDVPLSAADASLTVGALHRARRALLDGGTIFMMGDGGARSEALRVPLPGGAAFINRGWLALRGHTDARVLPVLTHLEGRIQVVTIHSPLPARTGEPEGDLAACLEVLGALLADYVQQFPAQCPRLVFRSRSETAQMAGDAAARAQAPVQRPITRSDGPG